MKKRSPPQKNIEPPKEASSPPPVGQRPPGIPDQPHPIALLVGTAIDQKGSLTPEQVEGVIEHLITLELAELVHAIHSLLAVAQFFASEKGNMAGAHSAFSICLFLRPILLDYEREADAGREATGQKVQKVFQQMTATEKQIRAPVYGEKKPDNTVSALSLNFPTRFG